MNASELYALTLSTLTGTLNCMLSTNWTGNLSKQSPETQVKAFQAVAQVQSAINHLSNAALADIAQEMVKQQDVLVDDFAQPENRAGAPRKRAGRPQRLGHPAQRRGSDRSPLLTQREAPRKPHAKFQEVTK